MGADADPLGDAEFDRSMAGLGPFEPRPRLACAVSGGPDSLCLTFLAARWAKARGGAVLALTVDHGLRPESAAEAAQVAGWMRARSIAHASLVWQGPRPAAGLPAASREARYGLLEAEAGRRGIVHLLLAHHRDDQAETLLMRLARGSGVDGLSAMAPVVERAGLRLLRPLLWLPKARLLATMRAMGHPWVEDPTNRNDSQARARVRAALAAEGADAARLAATAWRMGRARAALDVLTTRLLAEAAEFHPAGFVRLDRAALRRAPQEVALRALARCLMAVGGATYPPRLERLERLAAAVIADTPQGRTLLGCQIAAAGAALLVVREPQAAEGKVALEAGATVIWDRRFRLARKPGAGGPCVVAPLGDAGWRAVAKALPGAGGQAGIPYLAGLGLPALWAGNTLVCAPFLGFRGGKRGARVRLGAIAFQPPSPVSGLWPNP